MWKWDNVGLFGQCCLSGGRHNQDWHGTEMFINICKARTTFCLNITNREHSVPGLCHACPVNSVIMHYWTIIWEIWDCKLKLIKVSIIAGIQLNAPFGQKCWKAKFLVSAVLRDVKPGLIGQRQFYSVHIRSARNSFALCSINTDNMEYTWPLSCVHSCHKAWVDWYLTDCLCLTVYPKSDISLKDKSFNHK